MAVGRRLSLEALKATRICPFQVVRLPAGPLHYHGWWVQGVADVICSLPSYIYLGVNGDRSTNTPRTLLVSRPSTRPATSWISPTPSPSRFRTAGIAYVEFNGLIDAGSTYGATELLPCNDL